MKVTLRSYPIFVLLWVSFVLIVDSLKCSKHKCDSGKTCCNGIVCLSHKETCFNGWECDSSDDCNGRICVKHRCNRDPPRIDYSCSSDSDCSGTRKKCCGIVCRKKCDLPSRRPEESCVDSQECSTDYICKRNKCVKKSKSSSDTALTRAGFLSAAILTGSVFVLIMCCCFVKESKFARRQNGPERRQRHRSRHCRQSDSTVNQASLSMSHVSVNNTNGAFYIDEFTGDAYYSRIFLGQTNGTAFDSGVLPTCENQLVPPPYHTLSFTDLPPSYDEVVQDVRAGQNPPPSSDQVPV